MESLFDDVEDDVAGPSDLSSSLEITRQSLPIISTSSNGSLCKIVPEDDPLKAYYLLARYDEIELSLLASDGEKTWSGVLSKDTLRELSEATHLNEADHLHDTLAALQQGGGDCTAFVYTARTTSSGSLQLAWKKFLPAENIRFQLGSALLLPVPSPGVTHCQLFDFAIDSIRALRAEVSAVRTEKERLITERASALRRLEESVSLKEELERDLYGKFKVVLNDKKAKIRKLDLQVEQLLDENAQQQQKLLAAAAGKENKSRGTASNRAAMAGGSGSGSGSGDETDEEFVMPTMEVDAPGPSTSSTEHATLSSSLLDGGEEEGELLPVKRRRRKETSRTGQPVVIPKPPPARKRPVPSKQDSSSSTSSSAKGGSMESDELLNML